VASPHAYAAVHPYAAPHGILYQYGRQQQPEDFPTPEAQARRNPFNRPHHDPEPEHEQALSRQLHRQEGENRARLARPREEARRTWQEANWSMDALAGGPTRTTIEAAFTNRPDHPDNPFASAPDCQPRV
jgi:hypothetical protein